jgi:hypothetical protein
VRADASGGDSDRLPVTSGGNVGGKFYVVRIKPPGQPGRLGNGDVRFVGVPPHVGIGGCTTSIGTWNTPYMGVPVVRQ